MNREWNTTYERTMNHTYMVLRTCDFFETEKEEKQDYRTRMLLENRIPGILPVTQRRQNGETCFYYEINSLQSMSQLYEKEEIDAEALESLLHGCIRVFEKLEEYLLDGAQILLEPEYIYIHPDTKEPYFTYYPQSDTDVREAFVSFVDYLLVRLDHTQQEAVMLGYQVYRYTRNPNFVLSEITRILSEYTNIYADKSKKNMQDTSLDNESGSNVDEEVLDEIRKCFQEEDEEEVIWETVPDDTKEIWKVGKKEFIGVLISIGMTIVSGLILFFVKVLGIISMPYLYEMYLCGMLAMALVATGMFAYSLYKKREEWKEIRLLSKDAVV